MMMIRKRKTEVFLNFFFFFLLLVVSITSTTTNSILDIERTYYLLNGAPNLITKLLKLLPKF